MKLIKFVESDPKTTVLILDSISHEWDGKGGILDIVDDINKGFAGWKMATPMHNEFIDAMRLSRLHVIATMRTKTDYVVETNDKGKATPKKVGLKVNQREGVDYEFGIVFDIEINHYAKSSKDRTGLFAGRKDFKITPAIGKELLEWATSGVEAPPPPAVLTSKAVLDKAQGRYERAADVEKAAEIYEETVDQEKRLCAILEKKGIEPAIWEAVSELLIGKGMTHNNVALAIGDARMGRKPGFEHGIPHPTTEEREALRGGGI